MKCWLRKIICGPETKPVVQPTCIKHEESKVPVKLEETHNLAFVDSFPSDHYYGMSGGRVEQVKKEYGIAYKNSKGEYSFTVKTESDRWGHSSPVKPTYTAKELREIADELDRWTAKYGNCNGN